MKVLHLFAAGGFGGIESLCRDYAVRTRTEAVFVFAWEPGAFAQTLRAQGCRVVALGASRRNPAGTLHRLAALCRAEHPQALVLHHDAPVLHACALCLRRMFPRLCVVAYAHSNAADLRGGRGNRALALRRALLRASFRTADGVIAVSHSVRGSLVRQFRVPEQRVAVVYNGVDTGRFSPSSRGAGRPAELICTGRLVPEKGVAVVLRALALLPEGGFRLTVAGDGPQRPELERLARALGLAERVRFLGRREDVPELLRASDVFLHMPLWEEGFGLTAAEAMACGLVCMCARSGALPELLSDGETGVLVERGDCRDLARRMRAFLSRPGAPEWERMRLAARRRAADFSAERFACALDNALCTAICRKGGAPT